MERYTKYQTKQLHAHTYTCTHNSGWLALGWVTNKEYHPSLCIDYVDFMAHYKCNYIKIFTFTPIQLIFDRNSILTDCTDIHRTIRLRRRQRYICSGVHTAYHLLGVGRHVSTSFAA